MNRTLLYGEGLFETILWQGENYKLKKHYERLKSSAEFFGFPVPSYEEFLKEIKKATEGKKNLYVKFLVVYEGKDYYGDTPEGFRVKVFTKELPKIPESVNLCVSKVRRHSKNPLVYHKTTNFFINTFVKREAKRRGYYDAIMLNEKERVTETSSANLLLYKDGKFYTPSRESGLLWGTTLDILCEELEVKEVEVSVDFLNSCESVFILNSLLLAVPVYEVEGKTFKVDETLTKELREVLKKLSNRSLK